MDRIFLAPPPQYLTHKEMLTHYADQAWDARTGPAVACMCPYCPHVMVAARQSVIGHLRIDHRLDTGRWRDDLERAAALQGAEAFRFTYRYDGWEKSKVLGEEVGPKEVGQHAARLGCWLAVNTDRMRHAGFKIRLAVRRDDPPELPVLGFVSGEVLIDSAIASVTRGLTLEARSYADVCGILEDWLAQVRGGLEARP